MGRDHKIAVNLRTGKSSIGTQSCNDPLQSTLGELKTLTHLDSCGLGYYECCCISSEKAVL